jgi:hypothetical protein
MRFNCCLSDQRDFIEKLGKRKTQPPVPLALRYKRLMRLKSHAIARMAVLLLFHSWYSFMVIAGSGRTADKLAIALQGEPTDERAIVRNCCFPIHR